MSDLSRRSLLAGVPAAAVAATPVAVVAAVAVAAGTDAEIVALATRIVALAHASRNWSANTIARPASIAIAPDAICTFTG